MTKNYQGTIAYAITPYAGGTTTFYRNFAKGLRVRGWRVFSVTVGSKGARLYDQRFGDEYSLVLAHHADDLPMQVKAFLKWVQEEQVDIVIPMCADNILAAIPHLPSQVHCLTRCATITRSAYIVSTLYLDRLTLVVANSQRQLDALEQRWQVPRSKLRFIPSGVDTARFGTDSRRENPNSKLKLVYLGRVADYDKGVMTLPGILKTLSNFEMPFTCQIIGAGPDLDRLKRAVNRQGLASQVIFHGQKTPEQIPPLLAQADILLIPSRFEGFPNALLEAMAAGCVPVASRLSGVTDMIIADEVSGFLCPVGDTSAFAEKVALLHNDRTRLSQMCQAARQRVQEHYSLERMADDYDRLFTETLASPPPAYTPRPLSEMQYPQALLPTWRTRVPAPLKNLARTVLCRFLNRVDI